MDLPRRTLAKALTWQAVGLVTMTLLGLAFTGSVGQGATLAGASTLLGLGCYVLHERAWARVGWGRAAAFPAPAPMLGAAPIQSLPTE